jgi:ribosomal protein S6--L-glutamate ligase
MKIGLISKEKESYSTRRLLEEAEYLNLSLDVLDLREMSLRLHPDNNQVCYQSKPLDAYDVLIARVGISLTYTGVMMLSELEQNGCNVINSSRSIGLSRDKLKALQLLSHHHIPIPKTFFLGSKSEITSVLSSLTPPYIIKVLEGTQGQGVMLANSAKSAESIIQTLLNLRQAILIQEFIEESQGKDIRVFVVNQKVVAAMRRKAVGDEFRSNVHMGAGVESVVLSKEQEEIAIKSASVLGLSIAGVDLLESKIPLVIEVNSSPGLQGIEQATKKNIARIILDSILN